MEYLLGLNPQQQQAVTAGLGPVLVLAGPGSGKTRVLTQRIAYLIGALGVRPYQILAVTFTNKAARAMEERVVRLLGDFDASGLTLGTFHSTCAKILRREAGSLPFNPNFVIYDSDDQLSLVKRALEDLNIDDKRHRPQAVHAAISNAKNELIFPDDFPVQNYRDEIAARVYRRYQELLMACNALDFDDLLLWMVYLLEQFPEVRERYARRYEHILVDEFQDTNQAQYTLVKLLSSFHRNLFAVGDTDQSIYRWRGADYRNVLRFEQDFPDSQVILLEQNYRSTQAILDVAMAVIDRHPHRVPKRLFTDRGAGMRVMRVEKYDDRDEAGFVVETVVNLAHSQQAQPGEIAVMYRTNAQSRLLEEAFLHAGIRYRLVGAQRFYGRREVKDVIAYLRLVHNPDDELSLLRVLNTPPRGIGNKTVITLRTYALSNGRSPGAALLALADSQDGKALSAHFPARAVSLLTNFGSRLAGWRAQSEHLPPLQLMDLILTDVEYHFYLDDGKEEGQDRWDNIMELRRLAAEFQDVGLEAFLERVALVSDQDTIEESGSAPTLLTLHAAKGLEFPVVIIVGLNDGTLPHSRSFEDEEAMREERRLLYVGITRAKDQLILVNSQVRQAFGYPEPAEPSRFLDDIPEELTQISASSVSSRPAPRSAPSDRWQGGSSSSARIIQSRFPAGGRVRHATWGEGIVLNSKLQDDEEIVDIFFEGVGLKRVAASLAKMDLLE